MKLSQREIRALLDFNESDPNLTRLSSLIAKGFVSIDFPAPADDGSPETFSAKITPAGQVVRELLRDLNRISDVCRGSVQSEFLEAPGDMKEICGIVGVDPYDD